MNHKNYMNRCLQLAKNGFGTTYPNPMVGAVLVYENKIIGEGWHDQAGNPHAEVNAINSVKNKALIEKATLYVSLEPCSHFGKTPPCSLLIIEKKIKKVVVGTLDFNPKVAGKGIELLKNNGINVISGICEKECQLLNKRFFTFHLQKRPYIILKWAKSNDNFISPKIKNIQEPFWISNPYSQVLSHKWRTEEQAILVGTQTVFDDNPSLDARLWKGKNPLRLIIDKNNLINENYKVKNNKIKTVFFTKFDQINTENIFFIKIKKDENLCELILKTLYEMEIQSVIIEGGSYTLQQFINQNFWDEARVFEGNCIINQGTKAPDIDEEIESTHQIQEDKLIIFNHAKN